MISLILTNRNRDLKIVKNCFNSLEFQSVKEFEVFLVDYGSHPDYVKELQVLTNEYSFIKLMKFEVQGQLWNKSRAINIALQQTITDYLLVGDIDLLFHPNFIEKIQELAQPDQSTYFQTGFLSKKESSNDKPYGMYQVAFKSNEEATGITLFPTEVLKKLNGYDEFYHGWGAEDTDIHLRLKNLGFLAHFYNSEILVKHQWHPKAYRSKESQHPLHSQLERINHNYMHQSHEAKRTIVNTKLGFGIKPVFSDYQKLDKHADHFFQIENSKLALEALLAQMANFSSETVQVKITKARFLILFKNKIKQIFGKKFVPYLPMEDVNNRILLEIICTYRNNPYRYTFDRQKNSINLLILL